MLHLFLALACAHVCCALAQPSSLPDPFLVNGYCSLAWFGLSLAPGLMLISMSGSLLGEFPRLPYQNCSQPWISCLPVAQPDQPAAVLALAGGFYSLAEPGSLPEAALK